MSGDKYVIDTNIAIYLLNGDTFLSSLLQDQQIYLSIISEIELFSFNLSDAQTSEVQSLISSATILNLDNEVKLKAIEIRKTHKLKLPDCIIAATAITLSIPFISADKVFERIPALDLILYKL